MKGWGHGGTMWPGCGTAVYPASRPAWHDSTTAGQDVRFALGDRTKIEQAFGARPTGVERADAINIRIPIEGAGALTVGEIA